MSEPTAPPDVSDVDIEDVSLVDTPITPKDTPSTSEDTPKDTGSDTQDKPKEDVEAKDTTAKKDESQPETPEEAPKPTEDQPKEDPKVIAQRAYQERQRTRQQVEKQVNEVYGPKTIEQLVDEGQSEQDARYEALRQEIAFKEQRTQIAELNAGLQSDAVNVMNDFDVYNEKSKDYDPDFTHQVQTAYQTASRLQTDENGIVLNAEVGLYDFYKQMADIYGRGASKGADQGQAAAMQMLSRSETPGGAPGKTGDSLAELEERLGDVVIT